MRVRHLVEVSVLGDNGQAVCDGSGRNQRIGQPNGALDACAAAIADQMSPGRHHRLADGKRVGLPCQSQSIGATGPHIAVISSQHAELQLAEADNRDGHTIGELAKRPRDFSGDEHPGIQQS